MKPSTVLVCGNPTLDELVRRGRTSVKPGGSALFASCAAAYLGSKVGILGNIGEDYPRVILRCLRALNINVRWLKSSEGSTVRIGISRFNGSRKLRLVDPGDKIVVPRSLSSFHGIHLGPVYNEISTSLANTLRRKCNFLSADLQGFIRTASNTGVVRTVPRSLNRILGSCNMLQASIDEARSQTRVRDPRRILGRLLAMGADYAIVTMGRRGSWLGSQDDGSYFVPSYPDRKVSDSTGAGDVFAGSWLSTYLSTEDPVWASAVGSGFASLASRRTGLSKFEISRTELLRRAGWVYNRVRASSLLV